MTNSNSTLNEGYKPEEIQRIKDEAGGNGTNFVYNEDEINNDQIAHFYFSGTYEGKEVVFDAVMYTLRLAYNAALHEIAEEEAAKQFPDFKPMEIDPEKVNEEGELVVEYPEEIEEFMAQVMFEIAEEDAIKVQEKLDLEPDFDYGVGLEVALNQDEITADVIEDFVARYREGRFVPDPTLFSFPDDDEDEV